MRISTRRVRAIVAKELREYRRNGNIIATMSVLPVIFVLQPLIQILTLPASGAVPLRLAHSLLYMLAIPVLVPATLAAYSVVGERIQGTLEPVLSTPVTREELLVGKALAAFVPTVALAYTVFGLFVVVVELFARSVVASALIRGPDLVAQFLFTPLLAIWSIWVGVAVSTRVSDPRTAAQLSLLASLPTVVVTSLVAFNVIPATLRVALGLGLVLLVLIRLGSRVATAAFDRERLITSTR